MIFTPHTSESQPRVLVVDDEPTLRTAFSMALKLEGYEVDCAETGEEAIEKLENTDFSVVVLDLRMPGMGGLEVVRVLDEDKSHSHPPIIVASAQLDEEAALTALKHGVVDFLPKPVLPATLRNTVLRVLDEESVYRHVNEGRETKSLAVVKAHLRRSEIDKATALLEELDPATTPGVGKWRQVAALLTSPDEDTTSLPAGVTLDDLC